jgi:hypothetical protein
MTTDDIGGMFDRPATATLLAKAIDDLCDLPGQPTAGPLHLIVEDGNVDDATLIFCYREVFNTRAAWLGYDSFMGCGIPFVEDRIRVASLLVLHILFMVEECDRKRLLRSAERSHDPRCDVGVEFNTVSLRTVSTLMPRAIARMCEG